MEYISRSRPAPADRVQRYARACLRLASAGVVSIFVATNALASIIDLEFDLPIRDSEILDRGVGIAWQTQQILFPRLSVNSGDTIVITANILDGAVKLSDRLTDPDDLEGVFFAMGFGTGAISADAPILYEWEFLGVDGALDVNPIIEDGVLRDTTFGIQATTNFGQTWDRVNYTDDMFSFTGIRLTLEMPSVITTPFDPDSIRFSVLADAAEFVPAPEPPTITALAAGLIGLWVRRTRRSR
jgi:hypothetical protein